MGISMGEFKKVQQVVANNRIISLLIVATAFSLIIFCSFLPSSDHDDDYGQTSRVNFGLSLPPASYHHDTLNRNCSVLTGESSNSNRNISVEVHDGSKNGSSSQESEKVTEFVNTTQNLSPPVIQIKEEAALESHFPKEEREDGLALTRESSTINRNVSVEVRDGSKNGSSSQESEKVTEFVNTTQNLSPPVIQIKEAAALESHFPREEREDGLALTRESSTINRNVSVEVHDGSKNGSSSQVSEKVTEFVNTTQIFSPPVIQIKEEEAALESNLPKEETEDGLAVTETKRAQMTEFSQCDLYSGKWVYDESYPLYPAGECPFMSADFNCQANGRQDSDYTKWRWQPSHCHLPRLNASDLLERVRGKRVMFIGDSINRNQWESMLCILRTAVPQNRKSFGRSKDGSTTSFVAQACSFLISLIN